ncbi:uncharacterized protein METZ01_LOCUS315148 [marine metagenome]|uniref:Uncharacterized protein n=1 Tax=marine metagenome TaxID=408172 RepID=A0A382NM82_9ZZZZ
MGRGRQDRIEDGLFNRFGGGGKEWRQILFHHAACIVRPRRGIDVVDGCRRRQCPGCSSMGEFVEKADTGQTEGGPSRDAIQLQGKKRCVGDQDGDHGAQTRALDGWQRQTKSMSIHAESPCFTPVDGNECAHCEGSHTTRSCADAGSTSEPQQKSANPHLTFLRRVSGHVGHCALHQIVVDGLADRRPGYPDTW